MRKLACGLVLALGTALGAPQASAGGWNDCDCDSSYRYYAPPAAYRYYAPPAYSYYAPSVATYYLPPPLPPPVYAYAPPPPLRYFRPHDYRPAYRDYGYVGWRRW